VTEKLLFSSAKGLPEPKTGFFRNPLMNERVKVVLRLAGENICSLTVPGLAEMVQSMAKCEQDRMIIHRFVSRYSAKISEKNFYCLKGCEGVFARAGHMG
jgi:hypothetical protein